MSPYLYDSMHLYACLPKLKDNICSKTEKRRKLDTSDIFLYCCNVIKFS